MTYVHLPAPDDPAYLAWLDANPNGYVINTERGARSRTSRGIARWYAQGQHNDRTLLVAVATGARPWS
jgi:hypothetical protein